MTLKNCSKAYHPVGRLFTATLKRQTGITLLVTAFLLLLCPGLLWQFAVGGNYYHYGLDSELSVWAALIFCASLLLSIILLCFNHSHLFSRKSADLYYALPIKRDTLLAVRFGTSYIGAAFAMTAAFSGLTIVNFLPDVEGIAFGQMLKLYALCLLLLLLCMSTVLIFLVNSGSVFHFIFSTLVVCVGIPVLFFIGQGWYETAAYGVSSNWEWMEYISPFGYAIVQIASQEELLREGKVLIEASTLLIGVGGTLVFTAIAFLMNHRRKAEKSGGSFAYPAMPILLAVLASAVGGYIVGLIFRQTYDGFDLSFWFFFTVGAVLMAVAVGAIISRGFRKMWRWIICAGAATLVMLTVFVITDQAGQRDCIYIPEVEDIDSITIEGTYRSPTVTLTKDFELVTRLHEHILAIESGEEEPYVIKETVINYDEYGEAYTSTYLREDFNTELISNDFSICYTLKNGRTVDRRYWLNDYESLRMLFAIVQTEEYAQAWENDLDMTYSEEVRLYCYERKPEGSDAAVLTPEETRELLRVYGQELRAASEEVLWQEEEYINVALEGDNYLDIAVPQSFAETLALLEDLLD